ncbi:MAG: serine hydrolase [Anaerolineae bacterium]
MLRKALFVASCSVGFVLLILLTPMRITRRTQAAALSAGGADTPRLVASGRGPIGQLDPDVITSSDDRSNATPVVWWVWSGQTTTDILNFASANNARVVDISIDSLGSPHRFTVTYVVNTGAYQKTWWLYDDVTDTTLNNALSANTGRLTVVKAYDVGGGTIHFTAVMIANTGADSKSWWWYYNQTTGSLTTLWQNLNARITHVNAYVTGGQTRYAAILISNTGADQVAWYWWVNATVSDITNDINTENSRILDLDLDPTTGNYNVVLVDCTTNCPLWWWYVGSTGTQMLDNAAQDGARPMDVNAYAGCGGTCYAYVLINNSNDITTRVGQLLRNGTDGTKGLYLKEVNGSVLANLEDSWVFEPASAIKVVLHAFAIHQVQSGFTQLTNNVVKYAPPVSGSCPGNTVSGVETLSTALGEMMRHSDNTRTREISDTFGVGNIIAYAQSFGLNNTHINHIIGCGGPIPNQTTLDDLATLYEKVANGTLFNAANRSTFYSLMPGKAEYLLEGYDWTGLWLTDIPNLINQEAPLGMTTAQKQFFRNQMNLAYKAGNYKLCGVTCATYVDHIAIAGWAQIPHCTGAIMTHKQYVFGVFINNSTSDATSSATFNATKAELLREQIHDGLASCLNFHQAYLPALMR